MRKYVSESSDGDNQLIVKQQPGNDSVQLEISINSLRRLMAGQQLLVEELHCLNQNSQQRVRRLLMDYMMGKA